MSLSVAGVWQVDVWDQTVWADGVWREGAAAPSVSVRSSAGGGSRVYPYPSDSKPNRDSKPTPDSKPNRDSKPTPDSVKAESKPELVAELGAISQVAAQEGPSDALTAPLGDSLRNLEGMPPIGPEITLDGFMAAIQNLVETQVAGELETRQRREDQGKILAALERELERSGDVLPPELEESLILLLLA